MALGRKPELLLRKDFTFDYKTFSSPLKSSLMFRSQSTYVYIFSDVYKYPSEPIRPIFRCPFPPDAFIHLCISIQRSAMLSCYCMDCDVLFSSINERYIVKQVVTSKLFLSPNSSDSGSLTAVFPSSWLWCSAGRLALFEFIPPRPRPATAVMTPTTNFIATMKLSHFK